MSDVHLDDGMASGIGTAPENRTGAREPPSNHGGLRLSQSTVPGSTVADEPLYGLRRRDCELISIRPGAFTNYTQRVDFDLVRPANAKLAGFVERAHESSE